jgi:hypothetical protein
MYITLQKGLTSDVYGNGFIGNLELGRRYSDETVFRRVVEFHNPSNAVASNTLTMSVNNGKREHHVTEFPAISINK